MKKSNQIVTVFLVVSCLLLFFIPALKADSTPPRIEWEKDFGDYYLGDAVQADDGNIVFAGATTKNSDGSKGILHTFLLKINLKGQIEWVRKYPDSAPGRGNMIKTHDGGYAIAGAYSIDAGPGNVNAAFLIKTDSEGNVEWNSSFPQKPAQGDILTLIETKEGDFIIGGYLPHGWIIKADSSGNVVWNKIFDSFTGVHCLAESDQGTIMGVGQSREEYLIHPCLFELNQTGDIQWIKTYENHASAYDLLKKKTGEGYIIIGASPFYAIETDLEGNVKWDRTYLPKRSTGYSVIFAQDYGYLLGGHLNDRSYAIRIDDDGNEEWNTTLGYYSISAMCTLREGGYIFSGWKETTETTSSSSQRHMWVIKLASEKENSDPPVPNINPEVILTATAVIVSAVIVALFYFRKKRQKKLLNQPNSEQAIE